MEGMKRTNKKECPKCGSKNVFDTGARMGIVVSIPPGGKIPEPGQPVYECKECGEMFIFVEKHFYRETS